MIQKHSNQVLIRSSDDVGCMPIASIAIGFVMAVFSCVVGDELSSDRIPTGALLVESYEWHDADTPVQCRIRLPYGVILDEPRGLRAIDYDAWELGSRGGAGVTDEERAKGRFAVEELRRLNVGRSLYVAPVGRGARDSFGRPLGRFFLARPGEVIDLAEWARKNGHVRQQARK